VIEFAIIKYMSQTYNVYCDESCYLENDAQKAMVLGGVWCPLDKVKTISNRIREIKIKHNLNKKFEIKWTKVSKAKVDFYLDIVDYFFDTDDLHFRGLVIPDKSILKHQDFVQTHDEWYYKMYFTLLKVIFNPADKYRIYLDIKDTKGTAKIRELQKILCNSLYDFNAEIVEGMQLIRSHESEILQICDLLDGAISYLHRGLSNNQAKNKIIERLQQRSGYQLEKSTLYKEEKLNLLVWKPSSDL
jgi:hypothetical protein